MITLQEHQIHILIALFSDLDGADHEQRGIMIRLEQAIIDGTSITFNDSDRDIILKVFEQFRNANLLIQNELLLLDYLELSCE